MTHKKINLLLEIYKRISWTPDIFIVPTWFHRQKLSFARNYFRITLEVLKSPVIKLCKIYFWFHSWQRITPALINAPFFIYIKVFYIFRSFLFLVNIFTVDKHFKTFTVFLHHVKISLCNIIFIYIHIYAVRKMYLRCVLIVFFSPGRLDFIFGINDYSLLI